MDGGPGADDADTGLVRPYFRTSGRTRPTRELPMETLVSTSDQGRRLSGYARQEHRAICNLCETARSVAEIAAYLRQPIGVVRILVGDLADLGLVVIHTTTLAPGDRPSIDLMQRVLRGLREL